MNLLLNPNSIADYQTFLRIKKLPRYRFCGREAWFPDEYASIVGMQEPVATTASEYRPIAGLFDYQEAISRMAIRKKKFSVFADCGLGKTLILLEMARHCLSLGKRILICSPLMVIRQTLEDGVQRFYGNGLPVEQIAAAHLPAWLKAKSAAIGITNYDGLTDDLEQGGLGALFLDESAMLKSAYGKWGQTCIRLGRGLEYKLALTGTPAPNDRIEFANHAVFMDAYPTVNSFLARFFINRGQTDNRWELKKHAVRPFYKALSHWSIFLTNPATYGWRDNCESIPPIHVHIHDVDLTSAQHDAVYSETRTLFVDSVGGITRRSKLSQIGKGNHAGKSIATSKPEFIRQLVGQWPEESTIIWCHFNHEQEAMERTFPGAASIKGETPLEDRLTLIDDFKSGRRKVMISKPRVLGLGLNLQVATRQVFSGLQDSYEAFYQAVKRSNRVGSTRPLNVHIPVTEIERPMIETVLRKAHRVQQDTEEQEKLFKENADA